MLVAALLAAQAAVLAHEYDHALAKHNAPCVLHFYADHLGKTAPAIVPTAPAVVVPAARPLPDVVLAPRLGLFNARRTRAPPLHA